MSAQALARLTDAGNLERVRHGVYRIMGSPPSPWAGLQAAWLTLQPTLNVAERLRLPDVEVVSHRSATQLHRLGDLDADRLEFITPVRRQTRDREVRLHRGTVSPEERTVVDGLPVTTPLRTIVDLAATRLDGDHLAGVVRDAVTTLHLDPDVVTGALRPYAHHYGAPLGDGQGLLADLLQRAGVPKAVPRTVAELLRAVAAVQPSALDVEAMVAGLAGIGRTPPAMDAVETAAQSSARRRSSNGLESASEDPGAGA